MSITETKLRTELAACHHIIHYNGWDDLLATHLSARIPNTQHILITPHNIPFEKVSASNLIKCDFDGNILADTNAALMPQARNIHGEVYKARNTIMAAMHTHSPNSVAVSSLECGFLFFHQQALRFYNDIAYHDYSGLALENEGAEIVQSLKEKSILLAKNHGVFIVGESIAQTMYRLYYFEVSCKIQIKALSTGQKITQIPHDICVKTAAQFNKILTPEKELEVLMNRVRPHASKNSKP